MSSQGRTNAFAVRVLTALKEVIEDAVEQKSDGEGKPRRCLAKRAAKEGISEVRWDEVVKQINGKRDISAAFCPLGIQGAFDGELFTGDAGAAHLKTLAAKIEGALDDNPAIPRIPNAKFSQKEWIKWFRDLGRACEKEREEARKEERRRGDEPPPAPLPEALSLYLKRLEKRHSEVRLPGLGPDIGRGMGELYAELQTSEYRASKRSSRIPSGADGGSEKEEPSPPGEQNEVTAVAAARFHRVVLLGDPGSGKTTSLRHLCVVLARHLGNPANEFNRTGCSALEGWSADEASRLPVFVELRELTSVTNGKPIIPPLTFRKQDKPVPFQLRPTVLSGRADPNDEEWLKGATPIWLLNAAVGRLGDWLTREDGEAQAAKETELLWAHLREGRCRILLDGWDEVTDPNQRRFLRHAIQELVEDPIYGRNAVVVTCRVGVWGLDAGDETEGVPWCFLKDDGLPNNPWTVRTIQPLRGDAPRRFLQRWLEARLRISRASADATVISDGLWRDIEGQETLRRVAENPLLLSILAWLAAEDLLRGEAKNPYGLNSGAAIFEKLAWKLLWELDESRFRDLAHAPFRTLPELARECPDPTKLQGLIEDLAWRSTEAGPPQISEESLVSELRQLHANTHSKDSRTWAHKVLETLTFRAGLLRLDGPRSYVFMHAHLREYLAARRLLAFAQADDACRWFGKCAQDPGRYREILIFAADQAAWEQRNTRRQDGLPVGPGVAPLYPVFEEWLNADFPTDRLELGAELISEMQRTLVAWPPVWGKLTEPAIQRCLRWIGDKTLKAPVRAIAGAALGYLGDPRPGVAPPWPPTTERPFFAWGTEILPDKEFVMGGDPDAFNAKDDAPCPIPNSYRLAKYPITNAQYSHFEISEYFQGLGMVAKEKYGNAFLVPNHPVVGVSWLSAMRFCGWINEELESGRIDSAALGLPKSDRDTSVHWRVRLPTDAEWERAARHTDRRVLPWRNGSTEAEQLIGEFANCEMTGLGRTSAVGCFPEGSAPCGSLDLIGNVWEWCLSRSSEVPLPFDDQLEADVESTDPHVLRGGSWADGSADFLRAAYRDIFHPGRDKNIGFRLVCVAESR